MPHGMIHHWIDAMFVPNVTLDQVMSVLSSYDSYSELYKPLITKPVVLERGADQVELIVVAVQRAFSVTAALETDDDVKIVRPAPNKALITCNAVRVQEIADYGNPSEHPFVEARRPGIRLARSCSAETRAARRRSVCRIGDCLFEPGYTTRSPLADQAGDGRPAAKADLRNAQ